MSKLVCCECGSDDISEDTRSDVPLFCQNCCVDHDFMRNEFTNRHVCIHCGLDAPAEYFHD